MTKLLLDTCTLIWLSSDPAKLSKLAKKTLAMPEHQLALSEVSIMEICFKATAGKLVFPDPPSIWVERQIESWQLDVVPLGRSVMYRAGELALHHRDPFDRLLIASAIEGRATVVSPDPALRAYPVSVLW